jgi:outer membrane protein assembly factor BamE (lipoprotein component of BamABCDE complex)
MNKLCGLFAAFFKGCVVSVVLAATACSPIVDNRGHSAQSMDMTQIIRGQSSKEDVVALLGSPSAASDFGDASWYYITAQKETVGVFAPEITKQDVTEIVFDEADVVKGINTYGKEKGKPIEIVSKETPAAGHSLTFMEQFMGNLGRLGSPGRDISSGQGRTGRF